MRKILTILLVLLAGSVSAQTYTYGNGSVLKDGYQMPIATIKYSWGWNYDTTAFVYLPRGYDSSSSKRYATIFFLHGAGGNGSWQNTINDQGLCHMLSNGTAPYSVISPGDTTWFIVYSLAGQTMATPTSFSQMNGDYRMLIDYYHLKIDTTRLYATGLSAGGGMSLTCASEDSAMFAAIVPMSTVWNGLSASDDTMLYHSSTQVWQLHGNSDGTAIFSLAVSGIQSYNAARSASQKAVMTAFTGAHCCWETFYDPTWKWTSANDPNPTQDIGTLNNMSIYDWMLNYQKSFSGTPPTNQPPVANAGSDQTLASGTTSATLSGSGTDADGTIASYQWTTTSGATITSPTSASTNVTGMSDGNSYTFTLTVTDNQGATGSDNVVISVNAAGSPDTPDYKIVLSPNVKFYSGDTVFYQLNDLTASDYAYTLINNQSFDPLSGNNPTYGSSNYFFNGYPTHNEYPTVAVIDLGGLYKLTHEFIDAYTNVGELDIQFGSPYDWSTDTLKFNNASIADIGDTIYTRYLKVFYNPKSGGGKIRQIYLYGHLIGDSLSRIAPSHLSTDTLYAGGNTMQNFMGVNTWGTVPYQVEDSIASILRFYNNQNNSDTAIYQHNIDSIWFDINDTSASIGFNYVFPGREGGLYGPTLSYRSATSGENLADTLRAMGQQFFYAMQGVNQLELNNGWKRSIDYIAHPDADSTNPASYDRLSRFMWNYAGWGGRKVWPVDSMQYTGGATGLDVFNYIESGNENNGSWLGKTNWYSPQAWIAYNSAFYDGNNGLLGNRMGVKRADSSMKVVMGGDAYSDPDAYMRAMKYWAYYTRPDHSVPFDVYNFHHYIDESPEKFNLDSMLTDYVTTAHDMCPRCEVWNTEWGYDRNRLAGGVADEVPEQDSARIQADWITRSWLISSFVKGLNKSFLYSTRNGGASKDYDSTATVQYMSTGLTSGFGYVQEGSGVYIFNFFPFAAWYYQHTIYNMLGKYGPDSIIYENNDSLYVYRYRNVNYPDSVAYAIWSGTQTNRILNNYIFRTGHPSTPIEQVTLADKYMDGVDTTKTTDANGNLAITITESPKLYFTTLSSVGGTLADSSSSQMNTGPTLNISNQSTSKDTTVLVATATPGNSPVISYKWKQLSGPAIQFSLPSQNQNDAQVGSVNKDSTYTFKVIAMDANGLTDSKTLTLNGSIIPPGTKPRALLYIINGKIVLINN